MRLIEVNLKVTVLYEVSEGRPMDESIRHAAAQCEKTVNEMIRDHIQDRGKEDICLTASVHAEAVGVFSS